MSALHFTKMHGLGNDFAVFDAREQAVALTSEQVIALANRRSGIGFDQCIILRASSKADAFMQILNSDGSEVEACGNAARCVGWLLGESLKRTSTTIESLAGIITANIIGNHRVSVDMGIPSFDPEMIPLSKQIDTLAVDVGDARLGLGVAVSIGNPHIVFFPESPDLPLAQIGPIIEQHALFTQRVNVSLATINGADDITLHVWERGAGITQACGTATCATLAAAHRRGLTGNTASIHLPGGTLNVQWNSDGDGHIHQAGAVAVAYSGTIDPLINSF